MSKIGLIVDGVADLPPELIQKHNIAVVPVKMDWPELETIPGENTFKKIREAEKRGIKSFGKTSQPSPKDFLNTYKQQLPLFDQIICTTVTSKLSGTYNSAVQAKLMLSEQEKERIFIMDSLNACCGEAMPTLKALDLIAQGKEAKEIVKEMEEMVPGVKLYGLFTDPKWLEASGRLSYVLAEWVRRVQKIGVYPLLGIKKGLLTSIGIKTGVKSFSTALFHELESKTKKSLGQGKKVRIAICHGDNPALAEELKQLVEKNLPGAEVAFISLIDDILAVLVGPDALIAAWTEL
jgi:DegV family protein with EDD domain